MKVVATDFNRDKNFLTADERSLCLFIYFCFLPLLPVELPLNQNTIL